MLRWILLLALCRRENQSPWYLVLQLFNDKRCLPIACECPDVIRSVLRIPRGTCCLTLISKRWLVRPIYVELHQHDDISMGSPLGPILANIFVGFHGRQLFENSRKPCIYLFYVDDTFFSFSSHSEALKFFHKLNNLHTSLAFTMKEEKNDKLPFLDVLVERGESVFLTSIYRKPTFTGL